MFFLDLKTRKGYTRDLINGEVVFEIFYILKNYEATSCLRKGFLLVRL